MKLSMWSSFYIDLSPEDAVLELEKNGYTYSELSDEHSLALMERGAPAQVGAEFKKFADAHNITFLQGHLMLFAQICEAKDRAFIKQQFDLFRAVGVRRAVLHCDGLVRFGNVDIDEIRHRNVEALRDLLSYVEGSDLIICLENLRTQPGARSADELLWYIETLNSPNLGICLDTGHLNLSDNKDQAAFIRKVGVHLKALHLADNDGSGDQHLMPSARGQVDFGEIFRQIRKQGYDGLYNYEVPGERLVPLPVKDIKLDYIRKLTAYYWSISEEASVT